MVASEARAGSSRRAESKRYTPSSHDRRWRPRSTGAGTVCKYEFDGKICRKRGSHYCEPRADRVVAFFGELLVHTKSRWARTAFVLDGWQEHEIVRPLFGEVVWSAEWLCYVRRYRVAYIVLGRKNGKSELVAGIVLYLLIGDDEEAAEVYGAAKDTKQAGKVGDVVKRMRDLQPLLNSDAGGRLLYNKQLRRMSDPETGSYYEVITSDAVGELGHNPHGFALDEALSQPDGTLLEALRTAAGTRAQPLFVVVTTETNDPSSWGAEVIDEAERIEAEPHRTPHAFAYCRKLPRDDEGLETLWRRYGGHRGHPDLPVSCDPFDERNWKWPNPALDGFLSRQALREEAIEAQQDPAKENGFRQFRCNQRVQQVTRWMPIDLWDRTAGMVLEEQLAGQECYAGLDLAATTDLAAWVLLFPPTATRSKYQVLWRFWTPEAQLANLDRHTGGQASVWAREGLLTATEGDWVDYDGEIHPQIEKDKRAFRIRLAGYDPKEATATAQYMQGIKIDVLPIYQGFALSPALKELMRRVKADLLEHGGHPVARWNADSVETRRDDQDRIKIVKPARGGTGKRIDGIAALADAIQAEMLAPPKRSSRAAGF